MEQRVPILIVGAGPVGLLLANLLGMQGMECLLIDRRRFPPDWTQAIGITPPSLCLLRRMGLLQPFLDRGLRVERARVHDGRAEVGTLDFSRRRSAFPFVLSIPQPVASTLLTRNLLLHRSVTFCSGLELKGLIPGVNAVRALVGVTGGTTALGIDADWIIGCDGPSSPTRTAAGIGFAYGHGDAGYVMADYLDRTDWGPEARLHATGQGLLESFPLPGGKRRWIVSRPGLERPAGLLEERARRLCGVELKGLARSYRYEFLRERQLANTFWRGRVILAGDAAHVMHPGGGQGMNLGFGDADWLASLIPLLNRSRHAPRLLDDYERARKKAFQWACAKSAAGLWSGARKDVPAPVFRSFFTRWTGHSPTTAERLSRHVAATRGRELAIAAS